MKVLELDQVSVQFPDGDGVVTALDDIDFTVGGGEFVAVTGPSGSGKSTMLAVSGLLLAPTSGRVLLDGEDVTESSRAARTDLRRDRIGFVFQQPHLLGSLTAREQLEMVARLSGDKSAASKKKAMALLEEVGLAQVAGRRPAALSGGQRQRVGIARALMNDPRLLLVDEPTSALDHDRGLAIIDLLRRITDERRVGTIVVTHDLATLDERDEIVRIEDGRISESVAR